MLAFFHTIAARLRGFLRPGDLESDFDQEMAAHLEMAEEDGLRRGLSVEEARRAARVRLGGITQLRESWRAAWGLSWLDGFALDATLGLRVSLEEEQMGLDLSQHNEAGYSMLSCAAAYRARPACGADRAWRARHIRLGHLYRPGGTRS